MAVDPNQPTTEYAEDEATDLGTPFLELVKGMPAAPPVRLVPGTFVLGRDATADVTYAVEGVSRKHARITVEPSGEVRVVDLSSRNGTWLNGRRVDDASLRDGDELRIGPVGLRLRYVGAQAPTATPPAAAATGDLPLSARELEVAQLVADGMTNAEIGARLHISPATVGRHLSNVYERLGIHSRAALAARLAPR